MTAAGSLVGPRETLAPLAAAASTVCRDPPDDVPAILFRQERQTFVIWRQRQHAGLSLEQGTATGIIATLNVRRLAECCPKHRPSVG